MWYKLNPICHTYVCLDVVHTTIFLKITYGWLQGRVAHFLHYNLFFCRLTCIYMLLAWHKNNNFSNLWLDLNFQLEKEDIYKRKLQCIYTKYIAMDF
jgi:uncharacterized membrane protein